MADDSQIDGAWNAALRLLSASSKSRKELTDRLLRKGFSSQTVEVILSRLEKQGLVNDRIFAANLAGRLEAERFAGRHKIAFELKRRGIAPDIRDEILSGLPPEEEMARAQALADSQWPRLAQLPFLKRKRKLFDALVRKGFDIQIAQEITENFKPQVNES